ncbi:MAG: septal ring lytic transglycosylase RlpA family protein [Calditrichae bacterium]|nr:septal ring lytic transglycosylase RlpA family protein [Calditrichia bacterium]
MIRKCLLCIMVSINIFSCSSTVRYASNAPPVYQSSLNSNNFYTGQIIIGKSSYYGSKFHGRKTANGEIFDMYKLTAAHRELPFETLLKVTNTKNKKSVIVHVNDRGPFVSGRILDLSYGAAKKIDMINDGVADVILEIKRLGKSE